MKALIFLSLLTVTAHACEPVDHEAELKRIRDEMAYNLVELNVVKQELIALEKMMLAQLERLREKT